MEETNKSEQSVNPEETPRTEGPAEQANHDSSKETEAKKAFPAVESPEVPKGAEIPEIKPLEKEEEFNEIANAVDQLKAEIQKVLIGQDETLELLMAGILSRGHLLLEGVPGIAKTLMIKLFSKAISTSFKRIQFTPDLMPSDVIGTSVFNMKTSEFQFKAGPIFTNIVLIDEINRAPAKSQAALFETMEEYQVTVDGTTYQLDEPFFVLATQNPIEQEGTYKLPEAQLDRFLFRVKLTYPDLKDEISIMTRFKDSFALRPEESIKPVFSVNDLNRFRSQIEKVHIKDQLIEYIAQLVHSTRNSPDLFLGASPRASLAIMRTSKAIAAIRGRNFVTPDDIKHVAKPVLNHRIILSPEKELEGVTTEQVIDEFLAEIEIPR
ncbi:MoxR family ATPase [bacterium SCSIO 12741]|nr:MoxR family ATPase [bacterium SCSIO 12741]